MSGEPPAPVHIDVWSDVACPWCLLGNAHLAQALEQTGTAAVVRMRSYQLAPHLAQAMPVKAYLADKFGDPDRVAASHARLSEMGAAAGICYDFEQAVAANTFDAHRLHHLGMAHGRGSDVMDRLLRAQHTAGEDVSDHAVLRRVGAEAGLDAAVVEDLLASDAFADEVRRDIAEARAIGVQGVPFFVFDERFAMSGAQPVEAFKRALVAATRTR